MTNVLNLEADDSTSTVLAVDLDETLSRTDTLHEALLQLAVRDPLAILRLLPFLRASKAAFKEQVADQQIVPAEQLPYNQPVLDMIAGARTQGRKVILISAADQRQVDLIGVHFELFDECIGTGGDGTDGVNLSGDAKANYLVERFGAGNFDYIGDSSTDLPVWAVANRAFAVGPSNTLIESAESVGIKLEDAAAAWPNATSWRALLKAMRPHQWSKNVLIFLPMFAAQDLSSWGVALVAFMLFCMTASSVYILNDLVDLPSDREHPRKCLRPFASGNIPIATGLWLAGTLIIASAILAVALTPVLFQLVLLGYLLVTVAYSFALKKKLIVDIITLAGLYTLRILAGAAAVDVRPSPWLLAFSLFLFFSLAAIKRQGELVDQAASGKDSTPGRAYLSSDITVVQMMAISSGQAAVLVFALYLYNPTVRYLYGAHELLWLICPILLFWLSRIAILTHRGHMNDDPIVFAAKDRISVLSGCAIILVVLVAEHAW